MKKIMAVIIPAVALMVISFAAGHKVGTLPNSCNKITHKIEAIDSFCNSLIAQAVEQSCSGVEKEQQSACEQIVTLQAGMACEGMTQKAELLTLLKQAC